MLRHDPRSFVVLLGISAAVALAAPSPTRASVMPAPTVDGPTCPTRPASHGSPNADRLAPADGARSSSTSAGRYAEANDGDILVLGGIGDLFDGGEGAGPEPSVTHGPGPYRTELARSGPNVPALDCADPQGPRTDEPGKPLPRLPAEPGQPVVAENRSTLTGSTVTMTGLRIHGIVDLPTADGTLRALKFSMDRAITDDFLLRAPGPAGRTIRFAGDRLTLSGEVDVYATRFVGRLLGVTITLTADLPLPRGIPTASPITITFSDPALDLAFVTSRSLTARPALKLTLK